MRGTLTHTADIDVVVFDVLGTLVDEPGGIRAAIRSVAPQRDPSEVEALVALWQHHVEVEQRRMAQHERPYANTDVVDLEAAKRVADQLGLTDSATITSLATVARRLPPWHDSVSAVDRLAQHVPVVGLSNASCAALRQLGAHAGFRFHRALSSESVSAYKPAAEVYQLAVDASKLPPERVLMVAAHAWDLRGAQAIGMRTAYVERPGGDPPTESDAFDGNFASLGALVDVLVSERSRR